MPDLRAELESVLRPRFEIERELGGGGMSRVFVAREVELDRAVVIKVLPPEIAGVSLARFRRETQTAARLHHPHIVPLHTAGDAAGVLYYTMPFVDGETLRSRIAGGRALPIDEVVRIMRDVADALAYAHQHGLVHRDIKPDNVLLHSGHALVTDFGVAKALSASGAGGRDATIGTASGLAIGTPAYMAPEQAAGDPSVDHRADLYALGLLGYEMLAGKSPFASRGSANEVIAAHIAERPRPIEELRRDVPPLLASLIMRCLEKRAEDRPPSAAVLREQLDAMRTPSGGAIPAGRWPRRVPRAAAVAAVLPLLAVTLFWKKSETRELNGEVVAVAPFRVNGSSSVAYLREGMLDLFAAKLTGEGGPRAADPRAVLRAWRSAAGSDTVELSREASLGVAEKLGAGQLLVGDVTSIADSVLITARLLDVRDGRMRADARVSGHADSLAQLIDMVTAKLLTIRAGESARLSALTSTSLPALRAYLAGQWLYRRGRYKAAGEELSRAVRLDSTFALGALALMQSVVWYGDHMTYQKAAEVAWRHRDRLSTRDRALLETHLGPRHPAPYSHAEMIAAATRYRDMAPDRAEAWFQYADEVMHYGWLAGMSQAHVQAEAALQRAVEIDSAFAPALEHLVDLTARRGDTTAARRFMELFLAVDSASESVAGVRWRVAAAAGDWKTANALSDTGAVLPPTSRSMISWLALEDGVGVERSYALLRSIGEREVAEGQYGSYIMMHDAALMLGRPAEALRLAELFESRAQPRPWLRIKDALAADGDAEAADSAVASLRKDLGSPMPGDPRELNFWIGTQCVAPLWMVTAHGDASLVAQAVGRLRAVARRDSAVFGAYSRDCALILEAALAVQSRAADARQRVARADSMMRTGPSHAIQDFGNVVVGRMLESAGDPAAALAAFRRRPYFIMRKPYLGAMLRDEGRLAAQLGDTQGAIAAYRHYLALRSSAEPVFHQEVATIRSALQRLERAEAVR